MGQAFSRTGGYQYPTLEEDRHIRLLTLYPSVDENACIKCSVAPHSLNWNPSYEALSYTWGDPGDVCPVPIDFNGYPRNISTNLGAALRALRYYEHPRILWIDALCINQEDDSEKSRQVAIMGSIFESARNVVIWLGPRSDDSDFAMSTISSLHGIADFDHIGEEGWKALENLFSRAWFKRIWVVQEFKRGREIFFQCGKKSFNWDDAGLALKEFWSPGHSVDQKYIRLLGEIGKVVSMASTRVDLPTNGSVESEEAAKYLVRMLRVYGGCQATKPHDKIYGLLGLSNIFSFSGHNPPAINYSISVENVYIDWAHFLIKTQKSLDLLYITQRMEHDPALPSWVPNWRTARHDLSLTLDVFCSSFAYNGPKGESYDTSLNIDHARKILSVKGFVITTLSRSCMFFDPDPKFISTKLSSQPQKTLLHSCLMMGCKIQNAPGK
jgi:Heterokaryon incompatibility protein (HET)